MCSPLTISSAILDGLQQTGLLISSVAFTLHIQGLQVNTHLGSYNVVCVAYSTERERERVEKRFICL